MPILDGAVAYYKATEYKGFGPWFNGKGRFLHPARHGTSNSAVVLGGALVCTGLNGLSYAESPDHADFPTATFDIRVKITPQASGGIHLVFDKGYSLGFQYIASAGGYNVIRFSVPGSYDSTSPLAVPIVVGTAIWLRVSQTGSVNTFQYSSDGVTWTDAGTRDIGALTGLPDNTNTVRIGSFHTYQFTGLVHRAQVRSAANGPVVFDADFSVLADGTASFAEATGKTVTVEQGADTNDPLFLPHTGANYVYLPGIAGNTLVRQSDSQTISAAGNYLAGCTFNAARTEATDALGAVWTINRAAGAGRKSVAVDRPLWLLGTDDYFQLADHPDLNAGAGQPFTVLQVFRQWAVASDAFIAKRAGIGGAGGIPGWILYNASNNTYRFNTDDGTTAGQATSAVQTFGEVRVVAGRRLADGTVQTVVNGVQVATSSGPAGDLTNAHPVRFGCRSDTSTLLANLELFGVAIFRDALSNADIATAMTELLASPAGAPAASGAAGVTGAGVVAATGRKTAAGVAGISAGGSAVSTGQKGTGGVAQVSAGGAVAATGQKGASGTGAVTGGGSVTATGTKPAGGLGTISGGGSVIATGAKSVSGTAGVSGGGSAVATGQKGASGTGAVTGGGAVVATGKVAAAGTGAGSITGGGSVMATGRKTVGGTAAVSGGGQPVGTGRKLALGTVYVTAGVRVVATGNGPAGPPRPLMFLERVLVVGDSVEMRLVVNDSLEMRVEA